MGDLSVVSLNVSRIRGDKRYAIFGWLKDKNYDICLLQETYCTDSFASKFTRGWSGEIFHFVTDSVHSRGVCIMVKKELQYSVIECTQM